MGVSLLVREIVPTLSGEGRHAGLPTTIIRLYGCNLACLYCDADPEITKDIPEKTPPNCKRMGLDNIMAAVIKAKNKRVMITGGEPLLQWDALESLVYELAGNGYVTWIETNGSIEIAPCHYRRSWAYSMDVKCPSSGMVTYNMLSNIANLQSVDELKFVIGTADDYDFAVKVLRSHPTVADVIFSPMDLGEDSLLEAGKWLAEKVINDRLNVRVGLQIHKLLDVY